MVQRYSDRIILETLRGGDKKKEDKILKYLYQKCFPMALFYVKKYSGTYLDAKDVFHETIVAFYESVKQNRFRGDSSIDTYLYSIIKNKWITQVRRRRKAGELNVEVPTESDYDNTIDRQIMNLDFSNKDDHLRDLVRECMEKLGDRCRELLTLQYYEGCSMDEITAIMGFKNSDSAKTQKYKCLQKMISIVNRNNELRLKLQALR